MIISSFGMRKIWQWLLGFVLCSDVFKADIAYYGAVINSAPAALCFGDFGYGITKSHTKHNATFSTPTAQAITPTLPLSGHRDNSGLEIHITPPKLDWHNGRAYDLKGNWTGLSVLGMRQLLNGYSMLKLKKNIYRVSFSAEEIIHIADVPTLAEAKNIACWYYGCYLYHKGLNGA